MSQVSPDGRHVISTIDDPDAAKRAGGRTLEDKYYVANFLDYRFLQVFYPTRGILAWYDREAKRLQPLAGANDPRYVQTNGVWSPDGKYIVFARAEAKSPYPPGSKLALYANDPNELQIQYDLYRIPFNEGQGGAARAHRRRVRERHEQQLCEGVAGWPLDRICRVPQRNGAAPRQQALHCAVPGGRARLMKCNTPLMNSWHTFSPNGRWLAFSSKGRSPYTQLYLTHLDANGNDSPAILVDNTTASNRAVNLPEFANIPKGGLEKIDPLATEFYKMENAAIELMTRNQFGDAITVWRKALDLNPGDGRAHLNLGYALRQTGDPRGALAEFRQACDLSPEDPLAVAELALALAQDGQSGEAIANYRKSLAIDSSNAGVQADLGAMLCEQGETTEGLEHLEKAAALKPDSAAVQDKLAGAYSKLGRSEDAAQAWRRAQDLRSKLASHDQPNGASR